VSESNRLPAFRTKPISRLETDGVKWFWQSFGKVNSAILLKGWPTGNSGRVGAFKQTCPCRLCHAEIIQVCLRRGMKGFGAALERQNCSAAKPEPSKSSDSGSGPGTTGVLRDHFVLSVL